MGTTFEILYPHPDISLWRRAVSAGYASILADEIVAQREPPLSLLEAIFVNEAPPMPYLLTRRWREVLTLIAVGYTGPQVAKTLGISPYTVGQHIKSAARAMGLKTAAQAIVVREAYRLGEIH